VFIKVALGCSGPTTSGASTGRDRMSWCGAGVWVCAPLVVAEVLSPSTMDVDRGDKLRFYKALPTLRHIVLNYQDQMRVEHYRKTDMGWEPESLTQPEELLRFEAVTFEVALEHVYFGVELNNIRRLSAR
jgi:hypothetical protein